MSIVSVKFKDDGRSYYFDNNGIDLENEEYVLVETEKGIQFGIVSNKSVDETKLNLNTELKLVLKKATKKDYIFI